MNWIVVGCIAFVILTLFDLHKIKPIHPVFNLSFALGCGLLGLSTVMLIFTNQSGFFVFSEFTPAWIIAGLGCFEMFYALFFALPFDVTYVEGVSPIKVVDTGLYALCRHPGVIGFFIFYMFTALATGRGIILVAGILWTLLDVAHVFMQDRWFFPKTLPGYVEYKKTTPFLIFNAKSIKRFMITLGKKD